MHNQGVQLYIYLHRELLKILDIVFSGYTQEYMFVPPCAFITERYDFLLREYRKLEDDHKLFEIIDHLPLTNLRIFYSLGEQFDESIGIFTIKNPAKTLRCCRRF